MTTNLRHVVLGITALTIALVTAGCGLTPTPTPTTEPVVDPTPVVTPEPDATDFVDPATASGTRPDARTDATCADLATPGGLAPLFVDALSLAGPTRTAEYIGSFIPDEYFIRQAGGVACEWMDADSGVSSEGRQNYDGIRLWLLPATDAQFAPFSGAEAGGASQLWNCSEWGCIYDKHTSNGWWLNLSAEWTDDRPNPAAAQADATPVFTAIIAAVQALPAPTTPWEPPTPAIELGPDCTDIITGAQLFDAVGLSGSSSHEMLSYPSLGNTARETTGGTDCRWLASDDFNDLVYITVLPGGEWAEQYARQASTDLGGPLPTVPIAGMSEESPIYHHVDFISLDVNLGGNWIKIQTWDGSHVGSLDAEEIVAAVAEAIVAAH